MITRIVKIGNLQGIRIPKIILEQSGLTDEVELEVRRNQLIVRPKRSVRQGWEDAFRAMAKQKDDRLLDKEAFINQSSWDAEKWEW